VSLPALRTFVSLAAAVVLSVVLSVLATLAVIAVMNGGVILPSYAKFDQPAQTAELGICVNTTTHVISTPVKAGTCPTDQKYVRVQASNSSSP
jgi:hypothetical protein